MSEQEEKARKLIDLPYPTSGCDEGPLVEQRPGVITVRYDAEGEDGTEWTMIVFRRAIAQRFTPEVAITPLMVEADSCMCEVDHSGWLAAMRERASQQHSEIPLSQRHFMVFFDHYGCLEVVADSIEVKEVAYGPKTQPTPQAASR